MGLLADREFAMSSRGTRRDRLHYHLEELAIARDPSHPAHSNPEVPPGARVLDVGCGAGQTLISAAAGRCATGVDVDLAALALGRSLTGNVAFACATGEALPFPAASFDLVISRVALPYMHVPTALAEFRRVLRPGGFLWVTAHSIRVPLGAFRRASLRGRLFQLYVLANGVVFHLTLRQLRCPGRGCESFQTRSAMRRALRAAGFDAVSATSGAPFVVTGRVPGDPLRPPARTTSC